MTSENPPQVVDIPPRLRFAVPRSVRWGVADVGLAVGALVLSVLAGGVLAPLISDHDALQFWIGMAGYALIVVVIVVASWRRGQRSLTKDFRLAIRPIDIAIGIGVGAGARILSAVFVLIAVSITGGSEGEGNFALPSKPLWIVLNGFVLVSLVAPFVEELLVRGLVLQSVRNIVLRWRNREQPAEVAQQRRAIWISVIVSALVFSALHGAESTDATVVISLALSTFALGVANAWLVYATGRLGASIVSHITFNGSSIVLAVIVAGMTSAT